MTGRRGPLARLRDAYRALGRVDQRVLELGASVDSLRARLDQLESRLSPMPAVLRAFAADDARNRERLAAARAGDEHERAWNEAAPLVSVTISTVGRPLLVERALPSVLAQTHGELEVIVALDGEAPETAAAVRALGDPRVRLLELGPRFEWTTDQRKLWLVGATRGQNAACDAARGHWVAPFDDDDAMRPGCIERLLELARSRHAEIAYGRILAHFPDGGSRAYGAFPPRLGEFSWAAGLHHAGLLFIRRQLLAAELDLPGDWWLAERMLRAGARFAMLDRVLCDTYPSGRGAA